MQNNANEVVNCLTHHISIPNMTVNDKLETFLVRIEKLKIDIHSF